MNYPSNTPSTSDIEKKICDFFIKKKQHPL